MKTLIVAVAGLGLAVGSSPVGVAGQQNTEKQDSKSKSDQKGKTDKGKDQKGKSDQKQ